MEGHKEINAEADVSTLEREFDQLVYRLCGLTPEELSILEKASPCPPNSPGGVEIPRRDGIALMVTLVPFFSQPEALLIARPRNSYNRL